MKTLTVRSLMCLACLTVAMATATAQTDQGQEKVGEVPKGPAAQQGEVPKGPAAQQGSQRPQYLDLRYDEDWSHIKEVQGPPDFWDPTKYILLNDRGWYMSLGGEIRQRYDGWHNAYWGEICPFPPNCFSSPTSLNASLQRYLFHADTHFGEHVRAFVQIQSSLEYGKQGGPWFGDKDVFEIHQAFVDFRSSSDRKNYVNLRIGRQEIALGADHFISTGDYFNVRKAFDGAVLTIGRGSWTWLVQATKPVALKFGAFDDVPEHGRTAYGGGLFAPNPFTKKGRFGLFYVGLDTKHQLWIRGLGRDNRHTVGARLEGMARGWDYTYEALMQLGTFTPVQGPSIGIRAWAVTTETAYTFQKLRHYPRIGFVSSFTSGDGGHGSLGTFHPLFPDTAYSGKLGLVGPSNGYEATPTLRFGLTRRIYVLSEWSFFWRQNTNDGIYTPSVITLPIDTGITGFIERPGNLSKARYIGNQAGVATAITLDRHFTYVAAYDFFFPGQFLDQTPPAKKTGLLLMFLNYKF
jgi:hypothetical protein